MVENHIRLEINKFSVNFELINNFKKQNIHTYQVPNVEFAHTVFPHSM